MLKSFVKDLAKDVAKDVAKDIIEDQLEEAGLDHGLAKDAGKLGKKAVGKGAEHMLESREDGFGDAAGS